MKCCVWGRCISGPPFLVGTFACFSRVIELGDFKCFLRCPLLSVHGESQIPRSSSKRLGIGLLTNAICIATSFGRTLP